jgi:hypothetical protein
MIECTFELNGKEMSSFKVRTFSFPAFSGLADAVNRRELACVASVGPIPPGRYYVVDRPSGFLGAIRNFRSGKGRWFALYAIDGKIDDETFCEHVSRARFRLHPNGPMGMSQGGTCQ